MDFKYVMETVRHYRLLAKVAIRLQQSFGHGWLTSYRVHLRCSSLSLCASRAMRTRALRSSTDSLWTASQLKELLLPLRNKTSRSSASLHGYSSSSGRHGHLRWRRRKGCRVSSGEAALLTVSQLPFLLLREPLVDLVQW